MVTNAMQKAINEQINKEFYSSYLYLSMAAYFENKNLPGFAKWMQVQAGEEREHGMKFFEHLVDRGGKVELAPIAGPATEWKTNMEVFQQVQEHEAAVTASINALYELALKEKDYPAQVLLQWFITEQVEEEKNAADIVQTLEMIDAKGTAVLMLDHELGHRGK
jgi:ferritin